MKKVCLVIIYNHRYEKNIELLEKIYAGRFEAIYHLMPFYDGNKENVIPVYECSYQFQGYIAQALDKFYKDNYTDYLFIGDDLILNPRINQNNICRYLEIDGDAAYLRGGRSLKMHYNWPYDRIYNTIQVLSSYNGTNYSCELPETKKIYDSMYEKGYTEDDFTINLEWALKCFKTVKRKDDLKFILTHIRHFKKLKDGIKFAYPVFGEYSDIFMLPSEEIKGVAKLFGVFSAMRLFVEIAIPTAMKWHCKKLQGENKKCLIMWSEEEKSNFEEEYGLNLDDLFERWPNDCNYIHPIKLSRWKSSLNNDIECI